MKKFTLLLSAILTSILMMAQTPAGINYQTVVRNGDGDALPYTDIWLKVSILADAPDGTVVYSEVHPAATNGFGLVNLVIGQGTVLSGNFGEINWSDGLFYLETAINFDGGAGFQMMGVTQLLSVPFAKYADFSAGLKSMTTEEREALQNPPAGMTIYNTTTNCLNYWSGGNWFETCGACTPQPSNANAGSAQIFYNADTSVVLQANVPASGAGAWSKVSGAGGYFEDVTDPHTTFHGLPCTVYYLRWSISTSCATKTSTVKITFDAQPTPANAGDDLVFNDETTIVTLAGNNPVIGEGLWTVVSGQGGTFENPASPTTQFTGLPCQTYTLRWTIASDCHESYDEMSIVFDPIPTVAEAGEDVLINTELTTINLAANTPEVGSGLWTVSGGEGGVFADASNPETVFTFLLCENYTLRWTISTPCYENFDEMTITFDETPITVNAGDDFTICQNNFHSLNGQATNYSSVLWTTSGTGTFSNNAILNPTYTPSTADIAAGSVLLTLKAQSNTPCASESSDNMTLTIQSLATSDAGNDATICENQTYQLSGAAQNYSTIFWTTTGTGTFSNPTILNPVYTPSAADALAGSVTMILAAQSIQPCTVFAYDQTILTIQKLSTSNAGNNATICENQTYQLNGTANAYTSISWQTSGSGSFSNTGILQPVYTPSAQDVLNGSVILSLTSQPNSPCVVAATDQMVLTIQRLSTANAGSDATVCENQNHALSGTAQRYSSVLWTTSGTGTFTNPASLSPSYILSAADKLLPSLTLTLTTQPISPCAVSASDTKVLTIQQLSAANAGANATICENQTHTLNGSALRFSVVQWTTSGTGTFSNNGILNPVYTPSAADKLAGSLILTLTSQPISPCAVSTSDTKVLTFQQLQTANAGADATICENQTHTLNGSALRYSAVQWTTSGTGTFSNNGILNPVYTPSAADKLAGSLILTLTTQPISPCAVSASDTKVLTIQRLSTANAGVDATICANQVHQLSGAALRYSAVQWTTSGTGTFSNNGILNPVYTPSAADQTNGSVVLTLTAQPLAPCAVSASDAMTLTFLPLPLVNAGDDQIDISATTTTLQGNSPTAGSTGLWTIASGAGGTISQPTNPTSQFSGVDGETYLLQWTITAQNGCSNSDFVIIGFQIPDGSFELYYENQLFPEGDTITVIDDVSAPLMLAHMSIKNISNDPKLVMAKKEEIYIVPGSMNTFCWVVCWANFVFVSPMGIEMGAGVTIDEFSGDYMPQSNPGVTIMRYTFFDEANPNDSIYFYAKFRAFSFACGDLLIDSRDGNEYETIQIGNQCWMKENLKTTKYRNGTNITYPGSNNTNWQNNTTGAYAWYNNDIAYKNTYGALYNWHAVNNSAGLCPTGWHVPTDAQWTALTTYVSSQPEYLCNSNTTYIAKALAAKTNWNTYSGTCAVGNNLNTNNATNFTALPGGYRSTSGTFYNLGDYGFFWSSTEFLTTSAWTRYLDYDAAGVNRDSYSKGLGYSVRCVRD